MGGAKINQNKRPQTKEPNHIKNPAQEIEHTNFWFMTGHQNSPRIPGGKKTGWPQNFSRILIGIPVGKVFYFDHYELMVKFHH